MSAWKRAAIGGHLRRYFGDDYPDAAKENIAARRLFREGASTMKRMQSESASAGSHARAKATASPFEFYTSAGTDDSRWFSPCLELRSVFRLSPSPRHTDLWPLASLSLRKAILTPRERRGGLQSVTHCAQCERRHAARRNSDTSSLATTRTPRQNECNRSTSSTSCTRFCQSRPSGLDGGPFPALAACAQTSTCSDLKDNA